MKSFNQIFLPVNKDLITLNSNLTKMVGAKHPVLHAAAEHLFNAGGKRIRPAIVLLVAQATHKQQDLLTEHKRLAEITEIIHTASLVHDDVVDDCETRRGVTTVHNTFNTKVAVLAGDFMFAQSSWYLANLNNVEVVKTISKVITDFAEGEIRQGLTNFDHTISINDYIEKSFYKTASLIAASCKGAAMLSEQNLEVQNIFYTYGKHIGLAFQIIDDILDLTGINESLGKPSGSDLKNGNITAPIIFAAEEVPGLKSLINREFESSDDINQAIKIIQQTQGIEKAKDLAKEHIQASLQALKRAEPSDAVQSLKLLSEYIVQRIY
uniref:Prenyl transferase n=1 Tax=Gelidium galapagense TaxID=317100 RepID=A0A411FS77_9FLOR|nr:prenyl transferase [Gelidium galapagense]QBA96348.1 prenyl transferase [Gelidium galapagense]